MVRETPPLPMKKPSRDDVQLFRESVGAVKPVRHNRTVPAKRAVSARPQFREMDEAQVLQDLLSEQIDPADMETGEELLFIRTGLQHRTLRKLRRGMFAVNAELDLHGMTVPVARQAVSEFLLECQHRRIQCTRIIHGKGKGVLRRTVHALLSRHPRVLGFGLDSGPSGWGTTLVTLQKTGAGGHT